MCGTYRVAKTHTRFACVVRRALRRRVRCPGSSHRYFTFTFVRQVPHMSHHIGAHIHFRVLHRNEMAHSNSCVTLQCEAPKTHTIPYLYISFSRHFPKKRLITSGECTESGFQHQARHGYCDWRVASMCTWDTVYVTYPDCRGTIVGACRGRIVSTL